MPKRSAPKSHATGPRLSRLSPAAAHARPKLAKPIRQRFLVRLFLLLPFLYAAFGPGGLQAQQPVEGSFDVAIIIENRILPDGRVAKGTSEAQRKHAERIAEHTKTSAKAEIDLLFEMLDRQMFFEHIIRLERPTIEVICDIFGCEDDVQPPNVFPPLVWQITRKDEARLFVYYIGDGRVEGLERQLLFHRDEKAPDHDVEPYSVEWLHKMLALAGAEETLVMLDTGFAPRSLPCANEDPLLITETLVRIRRNYQRIARDHWNKTNSLELSATTPVQPPHCDRFDEVLLKIQEPLFTKFLLKGIVDGEADEDGDDLIDLGELAGYLDSRIKHGARFQWGRLQNVRAVGSPSENLASVLTRPLRDWNKATLERKPEGGAKQQKSDISIPSSSDDLFPDSTGKVRWLQMALTVDNWNPGPIDGDLGDKTRGAIDRWRRENGRAGQVGERLTDKEFREIMKAFGCRFSQVFPRAKQLAKEGDGCPPYAHEEDAKK